MEKSSESRCRREKRTEFHFWNVSKWWTWKEALCQWERAELATARCPCPCVREAGVSAHCLHHVRQKVFYSPQCLPMWERSYLFWNEKYHWKNTLPLTQELKSNQFLNTKTNQSQSTRSNYYLCRHYCSDGKWSCQSGAKEYHKVTIKTVNYSPAPGKGFLNVTTLFQQGKVTLVKLWQLCSRPSEYNNSVLLGEGFPRECYSSAPAKDVTSLLCSIPEKESLTQTSFKRFIGRVEKGSSKLNRFRVYIGLLRSGVFPGWRFSGWELARFQSP